MDKQIEEWNEFYRKNPPENILDDIGIYHDVEVPLPAKYRRAPCSCGLVHIWEDATTFYLEDLHVALGVEFPPKKIKVCNTCKEPLILEIYKEDM